MIAESCWQLQSEEDDWCCYCHQKTEPEIRPTSPPPTEAFKYIMRFQTDSELKKVSASIAVKHRVGDASSLSCESQECATVSADTSRSENVIATTQSSEAAHAQLLESPFTKHLKSNSWPPSSTGSNDTAQNAEKLFASWMEHCRAMWEVYGRGLSEEDRTVFIPQLVDEGKLGQQYRS